MRQEGCPNHARVLVLRRLTSAQGGHCVRQCPQSSPPPSRGDILRPSEWIHPTLAGPLYRSKVTSRKCKQRWANELSMRRVDRAKHVRDVILEHPRAEWVWQGSDPRILTLKRDGWTASLLTPFNTFARMPEAQNYLEAIVLARAPSPLPYQLDVWTSSDGKILSVEWDHKDNLRLISMKRGSWEQVLFGLP